MKIPALAICCAALLSGCGGGDLTSNDTVSAVPQYAAAMSSSEPFDGPPPIDGNAEAYRVAAMARTGDTPAAIIP
ncbi:MAG: hypothetical protein V4508_05190 [Pseudomonadota bacterium]